MGWSVGQAQFGVSRGHPQDKRIDVIPELGWDTEEPAFGLQVSRCCKNIVRHHSIEDVVRHLDVNVCLREEEQRRQLR